MRNIYLFCITVGRFYPLNVVMDNLIITNVFRDYYIWFYRNIFKHFFLSAGMWVFLLLFVSSFVWIPPSFPHCHLLLLSVSQTGYV